MEKPINCSKIFFILSKQNYKAPIMELLKYQSTPFEILIGTILSARTKDTTTAKVVKKLFSKIKKFSDFDKFTLKEVEELIYPVGFYKTKAKHLKALSGLKKVPNTMSELISLPGVGRKTASLVLSVSFDKDAIVVDTHVHKIMNRLGWVKTKNASETEIELRKILPKKYWKKVGRYFVAHGQSVCVPVSPFCSKCAIYDYCERVGVVKSR